MRLWKTTSEKFDESWKVEGEKAPLPGRGKRPRVETLTVDTESTKGARGNKERETAGPPAPLFLASRKRTDDLSSD